jgi:hypothetical protein
VSDAGSTSTQPNGEPKSPEDNLVDILWLPRGNNNQGSASLIIQEILTKSLFSQQERFATSGHVTCVIANLETDSLLLGTTTFSRQGASFTVLRIELADLLGKLCSQSPAQFLPVSTTDPNE